MVRPRWKSGPASLTLVRHAHSVGNHADARATEAGAEELDLDFRDADVELSDTGLAQAESLGKWMSTQRDTVRPTVVISSPYQRACQTAEHAVGDLGMEIVPDRRRRERALGGRDGLTGR